MDLALPRTDRDMTAQAGNILILEPRARGHYGPYASWIAHSLAQAGHAVTVVTTRSAAVERPMRELAASEPDAARSAIRLVTDSALIPESGGPGLRSMLGQELRHYRLFRRWYRRYAGEVRPDLVFVPCLDHCLHACAAFGSPFGATPWGGLSMWRRFHYRRVGISGPVGTLRWVKERLFLRLLRQATLRCLFTLDESLILYRDEYQPSADKLVLLPDPCDLDGTADAGEARRRLGLPEGRAVVLVYGSITARKGVSELLSAMNRPDFPPQGDVLLAGKVSADLQRTLEAPEVKRLVERGRVRLIDRFVEPDEEPSLFAASDIVWLGYRDHYGPSGVLVQAARARRPVLVPAAGILGWQTRRHRLGEIIDPFDPRSVIAGIERLLARERKKDNPPPALGASFESASRILVEGLAGTPQHRPEAALP